MRVLQRSWLPALLLGLTLGACGGESQQEGEQLPQTEVDVSGSPLPNVDGPEGGVDTVRAPVFPVNPSGQEEGGEPPR